MRKFKRRLTRTGRQLNFAEDAFFRKLEKTLTTLQQESAEAKETLDGLRKDPENAKLQKELYKYVRFVTNLLSTIAEDGIERWGRNLATIEGGENKENDGKIGDRLVSVGEDLQAVLDKLQTDVEALLDTFEAYRERLEGLREARFGKPIETVLTEEERNSILQSREERTELNEPVIAMFKNTIQNTLECLHKYPTDIYEQLPAKQELTNVIKSLQASDQSFRQTFDDIEEATLCLPDDAPEDREARAKLLAAIGTSEGTGHTGGCRGCSERKRGRENHVGNV